MTATKITAKCAAVQHSKSWFLQQILVVLVLIKSVIVVSILSVPEFVKCARDIFISPKKKSIRGWTALVTGGGNGLGKVMAEELAKEGCNVAVIDIDGDAAKKHAENLRKYNIKACAYQVDITNAKAVENIKESIESDIGSVDMLVNNCAVIPLDHTLDETEENIKRATSININSSFYTTRVFLPGMIERRRGHIVTVASAAVQYPLAFTLLYSSTKCGVAGFAWSLEEELRQQGLSENIKCTFIYPFMIATRKDITESINFRFPMLDPAETAKVTVERVLQNQREIFIHPILNPVTKLSVLAPYEQLVLAKTHILRDKETYNDSVQLYLKKCNSQTKILKYFQIKQ